jgi:flagellar hook assembly protein FlgD
LGLSSYWVFEQKPLSLGSHIFYWDGRDKQGRILDYYTQEFPIVVVYDSLRLPENTIIVTSTKPGEIIISSDPFAIVVSYGEVATITYTLPVDGNVSVSIYKPPDILINKLVDNQPQTAGTYSVTWDGTDSTGEIVSEASDYIIKVELTSGETTVAREGNITVDFVRRQSSSPF